MMPPIAQLTPEQQAALRGVLAEMVTGSRPRRRVTGRRAGLAILGSGVLTCGIAVVAAFGPAEPPAARSSVSAPAMLDMAAATVRSEPVVKPGQYLVVTTRADYLAATSSPGKPEIGYLSPEIHETFIPYDKSPKTEVWRTTYLRPTVFFGPGARDFAAADRAGQKQEVVVERGPRPPIPELGGGTAPPPIDPGTLPLDPPKLLAFPRAYEFPVGGSPDENAFGQAMEILRVGDVTPSVRAALYRALSLIASVTITGQTTALDGTEGIAFSLSTFSQAGRQEIIIDPGSGQYLGERLITVDGFGAIPAGTAMESTSVTLSVADKAP